VSLDDFGPLIAGVVAWLVILVSNWVLNLRLERKKRETEKQIREITLEFGDSIGNLPDLASVVSTSAAHAPSGFVDHEKAIRDLRLQVEQISEDVERKKNEIVEVHRIDPVLEASLKASIDNLTQRIEALEKNLLTKWDVALVVLQLLGGIGVIIGIVFAMLKLLP